MHKAPRCNCHVQSIKCECSEAWSSCKDRKHRLDYHCLKQTVWSICGHILAQSTDPEIKATTDRLGSLTSEMLIASLSDMATGSSLHHFAHIVHAKSVISHLLTVLTNHACQHNSFWGSRCVSSHAPTIYLKPVLFMAISAYIFWH